MLCGIHSPSSHHHHRFLRSFRSHKNLRSSSKTVALSSSSSTSQDDMMYHYPRRPSDASSLDSTGRRPSTSSRSDVSIDCDPLRLHPPSVAPGPAPPLRETLGEERASRPRYHPHELRHVRSSHALRQPLSPSSSQSSSNTVIYDGFDFGFNNKPTTLTPTTTTNGATTTARRMTRSRSPTPSDASSECSISIGSDLDDDAMMMGLAPAPAPRPRPRPRLHHHNHLTGPSGLPLAADGGDAEYFMRRGGWKRRGIVFVNTMPLAGEEESFEI